MIRQRKPLERRTTLQAKTQLSRSSSLSRGPVKPRKHPTATDEEKDSRAKVEARSGGMCEVGVPGVCQGQGREFQHRQAKGQLGQWTASNGLRVCGHGNTDGCHGHIHSHPTEAYAKGWSVRSWDNPLTRPVLYRGQWVLLDNEGTYTPSLDQGAA